MDSLHQIQERGGGIELAVERRKDPLSRPRDTDVLREPPRDLLWRVKLLDVGAKELICEAPGTMGRTLDLDEGTKLVCVMAIGQTRWMFHSNFLGQVRSGSQSPDARPPIRIATPERVERCTRRSQQRISTASLDLPDVYAWQLRDPASAIAAETASHDLVRSLLSEGKQSDAPLDEPGEPRPDLGPGFRAQLGNIGGGGVGLNITKEERSAAESTRLYWVRLDLRPIVPAPVCLTARLAHSHIDAMQNMYAGMAFEFALNPTHRDFVVDHIGRYASHLQETANAQVEEET